MTVDDRWQMTVRCAIVVLWTGLNCHTFKHQLFSLAHYTNRVDLDSVFVWVCMSVCVCVCECVCVCVWYRGQDTTCYIYTYTVRVYVTYMCYEYSYMYMYIYLWWEIEEAHVPLWWAVILAIGFWCLPTNWFVILSCSGSLLYLVLSPLSPFWWL